MICSSVKRFPLMPRSSLILYFCSIQNLYSHGVLNSGDRSRGPGEVQGNGCSPVVPLGHVAVRIILEGEVPCLTHCMGLVAVEVGGGRYNGMEHGDRYFIILWTRPCPGSSRCQSDIYNFMDVPLTRYILLLSKE